MDCTGHRPIFRLVPSSATCAYQCTGTFSCDMLFLNPLFWNIDVGTITFLHSYLLLPMCSTTYHIVGPSVCRTVPVPYRCCAITVYGVFCYAVWFCCIIWKHLQYLNRTGALLSVHTSNGPVIPKFQIRFRYGARMYSTCTWYQYLPTYILDRNY